MIKIFIAMALVLSNILYAGSPIVIGIAGGTGSGKTTLARTIQSSLGADAVLIEQDCYYKDLAHLPFEERDASNFDHPNSIDFERLSLDVMALKQSLPIEKPIYSFKIHAREAGSTTVVPTNLIIVEGILIFTDDKLRNLFDLKIFVETDDDIRILRRCERDMEERGRKFPHIMHQYLTTVKPMHTLFVEPSKQYADVIIPGVSDTSAVVDLLLAGLRAQIQQL